MTVIIPIATIEPEFEKGPYGKPRPLVEVGGQKLIEWVTKCAGNIADENSYTFVVLKSHVNNYSIDKRLEDVYSEDINIVSIEEETDGAAQTVLAASNHITDDDLLVVLGDQYIEVNMNKYISESNNVDGLIPVFKSEKPTWSYAATSSKRTVSKVAEKEVISSNATAGVYYFANGMDFVRGATKMIKKGITTSGLFYVCPVYNELIQMSKRIEIMPVDRMVKLSSPEDIRQFESSL